MSAPTPEEIEALFADAFKEAALPEIDYVVDYNNRPLRSSEPVKEAPGAIQNSGVVATETEVLVPHMSTEELGRNEPSRGKKMVAIKPTPGIGVQTFYTLLSNAYALYVTEGTYSNDALQQRTGFAPGTITKTLASPEFKRALSLRGVKPTASGLTTEQDYVLLALTDPSDGKTLQQKLRSLGVSYAKYRGWMKQPLFKMQIDSMTQGLLHDNTASLVQLEKLAGEGDLPAIKYKHELNGLYDPNKQNSIDALALMSLLFEVVSRHVNDSVALAGIAQELGEVAQQLKLEPKQIGY